MTDEQFQALQNYLNAVAPQLLLGDWELWLLRERCPDKAWAYVEIAQARDTAWVQVAYPEYFDGCTPEEQRLYITHELTHILVAQMERPVLAHLDRMDEGAGKTVLESERRLGMERTVHKIARIIAPTLPMPDFPRTKEPNIIPIRGTRDHYLGWQAPRASNDDPGVISPPNANIASLYVDPRGRE